MKGKNKYLLIALAVIIAIIVIVFCFKNIEIKANQNVKNLKYYVPSNYKIRSDLRGLVHTDETRKIFAIGDNTDYNTFIWIDVIREQNKTNLKEYVDDVNTNSLKDEDVKYIKKDHEILEIYGREEYETQQGQVIIINYAYITSIDNDFYTITISGPKEKKDEVSDLASKVFKTLEKNTSD